MNYPKMIKIHLNAPAQSKKISPFSKVNFSKLTAEEKDCTIKKSS